MKNWLDQDQVADNKVSSGTELSVFLVCEWLFSAEAKSKTISTMKLRLIHLLLFIPSL